MAPWVDLEGCTIAERYEMRTHIATGGMATVYRGWDLHMRRAVAIKLLRDDGDAGEDGSAASDLRIAELARFHREARAGAALRSPHIVRVYDFVEDRGRAYLIMELVDGPNLKQRILEAGPLATEEVLTYAIHVCRALAQIHAHGYVHRDIKPQNILLAASSIAKLTDFGIVHVGGASSLTASGLVLGTADYIAPEQAQGLALGPASDLYSLGIVLFEMLTATVPFTGATATAVAVRHTTEPLPSLRLRNPDVPPLVERIVQRASAKDPARRFSCALQLETALTHALAVCGAHRPAATLATATCSRPDAERAVGGAIQAPASSWDADRDGDEAEALDWHDVAALLPTAPHLSAAAALAMPAGDLSVPAPAPARRSSDPARLQRGRRGARVRAWIATLLHRPFGSVAARYAPCGPSARLALALSAALLLCVAVLVLRMLP